MDKKYHCFNCGAKVHAKNIDELPNGRRVHICDSPGCEKELRETWKEMENEARQDAEEDGYSRYY